MSVRSRLVRAVSSARVWLALTYVVFPRFAVAQDTTATAQALFESGRDLLRAGKIDEACPKLAESQRIEPATGTLLALAMCHEAQGKFASAWSEFTEVAARAATLNQTGREVHARSRVDALKPRLSTLQLKLPFEIIFLDGLEVRLDGVLLERNAWHVGVPVDGGEHAVEVRADGRKTWTQFFTVAPEHDKVVVQVEELEFARRDAATSKAPPMSSAEVSIVRPNPGTNPIQTNAGVPLASSGSPAARYTGVTLAGVGAATLVAGGVCFLKSYQYGVEGRKPCSGEACAPVKDAHGKAWTFGNWATGLGIAGGAVLLTGAALYWGNRKIERKRPLRADVAVGPSGGAVLVSGEF